MINIIRKNIYFSLSVLVTSILFIPNFLKANIGSDWDSYALIGTLKNFEKYNVYIPSRPPGFPIYELVIGFLFKITGENKLISPEQVVLLFQLILIICLNFLIYSFFKKNKNKNYIIYLLTVFSPIYLISGFSVIDYVLGAIFGFLAIYQIIYNFNSKYIIFSTSLYLGIALGIRLSNIIFLFVVTVYLIFYEKNLKTGMQIGFLTIALTTLIYFPFYRSLYIFYVENGIYQSPSEMICIINLTNTDHNLLGRLGRFFLKQINFFGTIGFLIFLIALKDFKFKIDSKNLVYFGIFLIFQISFFRLPTEEGHLLPAYIAFMLMLNNIEKLNSKLLLITLLFTFSSNFGDVKFYKVDNVDSASEIEFNFELTSGFYVEDYEIRNEKGLKKDFHYENSQYTLFEAWKSGCPN